MSARADNMLVEHVLTEAFPDVSLHDWDVQPLAAGGQARLFIARRPDSPEVLVVKLFDHEAPEVLSAIAEEFKALKLLGAVLDDRRINGWRLRVPLSLHKSIPHAALVMTAVPGRPLRALLRDGEPEELGEILQVIGLAIQQYWDSHHLVYGDFNLANILCDIAGRTISFIDCGMPRRTWACECIGRRWYPASRDLAYLLYWWASGIRSSLVRGSAARRREGQLVCDLVQRCVQSLASPDDACDLLSEIEQCAMVHVSEIRATFSPAGAWRAFVRWSSARTIRRVIRSMREALAPAVPPDSLIVSEVQQEVAM